jgi:hypothetical protein
MYGFKTDSGIEAKISFEWKSAYRQFQAVKDTRSRLLVMPDPDERKLLRWFTSRLPIRLCTPASLPAYLQMRH